MKETHALPLELPVKMIHMGGTWLEQTVEKAQGVPSAVGGLSFLSVSTLFFSLSVFSFSFFSFLKTNKYQIAQGE